MSDLTQRLKNLTPEQQKLLKARLDKKKTTTAKPAATAPAPKETAAKDGRVRKMDFGLYFFSDDGTGQTGRKYQLLTDAARYADENGFGSVWTPERHFQTFGGLYPNPSVLGAALSTITKNVRIRCGSTVLPLHHPIRVAEEWGVVDNLSDGRVDISFATGWHQHDYVIRPQNFEDRRKIMFRDIDVVRALWRGDEVEFTGVNGEEAKVRTLPRPVQPELPFWITVASPHTFVTAGEMGANILTMLPGSPEDLRENITAYRKARTENGHDPRKGIVSLMLHTFLGDDEAVVKEQSRQPMYRYLSNYLNQFASMPGAPKVDNTNDLLAFAFERYFNTGSLLGTVEKVEPLVSALADVGVNDIACLIDFGVDKKDVMDNMHHLTRLKDAFKGQ